MLLPSVPLLRWLSLKVDISSTRLDVLSISSGFSFWESHTCLRGSYGKASVERGSTLSGLGDSRIATLFFIEKWRGVRSGSGRPCLRWWLGGGAKPRNHHGLLR